jgi:hypothetical protein
LLFSSLRFCSFLLSLYRVSKAKLVAHNSSFAAKTTIRLIICRKKRQFEQSFAALTTIWLIICRNGDNSTNHLPQGLQFAKPFAATTTRQILCPIDDNSPNHLPNQWQFDKPFAAAMTIRQFIFRDIDNSANPLPHRWQLDKYITYVICCKQTYSTNYFLPNWECVNHFFQVRFDVCTFNKNKN